MAFYLEELKNFSGKLKKKTFLLIKITFIEIALVVLCCCKSAFIAENINFKIFKTFSYSFSSKNYFNLKLFYLGF
jgi:hypothetical protein